MTPLQIEQFTSSPRFARYVRACGDREDALRLYSANVRISMAYYPLLSLFETFLRNQINNELTAYCNNSNWILTERNPRGFMNSHRNYAMHTKTGEIIQRLNSDGIPVTAGKVISELTFGFWTRFFKARYYGFVSGRVIRCFPNRPRQQVKRFQISEKLERIRRLRNRVYHNEPICFGVNGVDFALAQEVHQDVLDLFAWMDPVALNYVVNFDQVIQEIDAY